MTATIRYLRSLRRLKEEQATKVGRQARVRLFRRIPSFPWVELNPCWWERGRIITEHDDKQKYRVRFKDLDGQPCWHEYSAENIKILPETK